MAVEQVTGATPVWFVEYDAAPSKILAHHWPDVPNYGDVTKVDWATMPPVDILTGGSPCQDLSAAGKRAGMTEGTRSNLWVNMREAINIIRPCLVVWENVLGALSATATSDSDMEPGTGPLGDGGGDNLRALGRVLGDLAEIGYDAQWTTLRASDVGAPHHRERLFIVASPADTEDDGRDELHDSTVRNEACSGRFRDPPGGDRRKTSAEPRDTGHADTDRQRRDGRGTTPEQAGRTHPPTDRHSAGIDFGPYTPAVRYGGMNNGNPAESGPAEVLRDMRGGVLPQEVQRPTRGQNQIPEPKDMRTDMREQQKVSPGRFPQVEGATDPQANGMRDMPLDPESSCAPQGQEPGEQRGGKPGHAVRELPPETSLGGGQGLPGIHNTEIDWGPYTQAIRRWERILGRPAPNPTELNRNNKPRLAAPFAEYMMGLPAGHVTQVPGISRADQLKAIGNGVCVPQGIAALRILLDQLEGF